MALPGMDVYSLGPIAIGGRSRRRKSDFPQAAWNLYCREQDGLSPASNSTPSRRWPKLYWVQAPGLGSRRCQSLSSPRDQSKVRPGRRSGSAVFPHDPFRNFGAGLTPAASSSRAKRSKRGLGDRGLKGNLNASSHSAVMGLYRNTGRSDCGRRQARHCPGPW